MAHTLFRYHPFEIHLDTQFNRPPQKWINQLLQKLPWKVDLLKDMQENSDPKHLYLDEKFSCLNSDLLFLDGHNSFKAPRIVFHNSTRTLDALSESEANGEEIICHILFTSKKINSDVPSACRAEDFEKIQKYLSLYIERRTNKTPLNALILTGGKSRRMERDKSLLNYHGKPQWLFLTDLLSQIANKVFISCRKEQCEQYKDARTEQIQDSILDKGPLGGILSAQFQHPQTAWLVVACDLPYLTKTTLDYLLSQRDPLKLATAFTSEHDGLPEPLCAIYEPKSHFKMMQFLSLGVQCPRKILIQTQPHLLRQVDKKSLDNINHYSEYKSAKESLTP